MKTEDIKIIHINNTKIANEIRKIKNLAGVYRQITVGLGDVITSYGISENLSYFDMVVADAAYTLQVKGFENISAGQVMRVMSGNMAQSLSAVKKKKIENSMRKMMETMIYIDCEHELRARGMGVIKNYTPEQNRKHDDGSLGAGKIYRRFLPCEETSKNKFRFTDKMPLYQYAETISQMIPVPVEQIQNPDSEGAMSDTWDTVLIKRYLLQWLEIMKHKNSYDGRKIIYSRLSHGGSEMYAGMLPTIDINRADYASASSWNRKIGKVHNVVKKMLDSYKEQGYIEGYFEIKNSEDKDRILGVMIKIKETDKKLKKVRNNKKQ